MRIRSRMQTFSLLEPTREKEVNQTEPCKALSASLETLEPHSLRLLEDLASGSQC